MHVCVFACLCECECKLERERGKGGNWYAPALVAVFR